MTDGSATAAAGAANGASATASAERRHVTLRCQFCHTWNRIDAARAADRPKCGNCAKPMLLDRPWSLDDESFDRTVRETEIPVLVDFWAEWCAPCKMMAPAVDQLASKFLGRVLVAKLDTDRAQRVAATYQIRAIPTVILFQGGKEAARQAGAMPLAGLEAMLARAGVT
ncbi:MAG: thioredoxin [Gemmatimonadaceae bacterium]